MKSLAARLQKLESIQPGTMPLSLEDSFKRLRAVAAERGLSESDVVQLYGSLPGFAHALMSEKRAEPDCQPDNGLSAQERYMRMLSKKA